jgi:methylenetetrahydrofolate reductase (NADPH)
MKVTDHLARAERPLISFEIIPPLRGGNLGSLLALIEDLARWRPPFIDITSHAAQAIFEETTGGYQRRIKRKRPGTLGVCALIQQKYAVDAVPHILCQGFTREETEDFLIELNYLGIDNVLAIRGDDNGFKKPLPFGRSANEHALQLVEQVCAMNRGRYLEADLLDAEPTDFCVGVAGYPEKHFEAPNLAADLRWTRAKVEAGAEYVVTQMFFDNQHYFRYVEECRGAGIEVPVIPGLKILSSPRQLVSIPRTFYTEVPPALADEVEATDPERAADVGVEWALAQTRELLEAGVPAVHFYVMHNSQALNALMQRLAASEAAFSDLARAG